MIFDNRSTRSPRQIRVDLGILSFDANKFSRATDQTNAPLSKYEIPRPSVGLRPKPWFTLPKGRLKPQVGGIVLLSLQNKLTLIGRSPQPVPRRHPGLRHFLKSDMLIGRSNTDVDAVSAYSEVPVPVPNSTSAGRPAAACSAVKLIKVADAVRRILSRPAADPKFGS